MISKEFRKRGKEMVDYICKYRETMHQRKVTPNIEPGYLRNLLPPEAPMTPDNWDDVLSDVEDKIMPGVLHWAHPKFNAYFPNGNAYPGILADMLSGMSGGLQYSWDVCPAFAELEVIMMDWWGKALGLPCEFLHGCNLGGGGVIQGSASESILVSMLAARNEVLIKLREEDPENNPNNPKHLSCYLPRLVAYKSKEGHSCIEKAALICQVSMRLLEADDKHSLRGDTLQKALKEDEDKGLTPFFVCLTLGTTSVCSFDNVDEIGKVCCENKNIWLHVDCAYAGSALMCPEYKYLMKGFEYVESLNIDGNKFMLVIYDCAGHWVRNMKRLNSYLRVEPLQEEQHEEQDHSTEFSQWGIPFNRRCRAIKLWCIFRWYGIEALQEHFRHHACLAKYFEQLVIEDGRFEIVNEVKMSLVCMRLLGPDQLTKDLVQALNESGEILVTKSDVKGKFIMRFCVVQENATEEKIYHSWTVIEKYTTEILSKNKCEC